MSSSVAVPNSIGGFLKEHVYALLPMNTGDLEGRIQAALTTTDANMLRRVRENAVRRTGVWLEMDEGRFEHLS
jgi:hypothetical protein